MHLNLPLGTFHRPENISTLSGVGKRKISAYKYFCTRIQNVSVQSVVAGMVINPIRGKYPQIMFHEIMSSKISTHLQEVVLEVIA